MKITKKHIFSFIILSLFCLSQAFILLPLTSSVQAAGTETLLETQTGLNEIGQVFGNEKTDLRIIAAKIINIILGFVAIVFLVLLLIAGYRYMMAGGNEEKTKYSTTQIRNAIIGLMVTMGAWAISRWVLLRIRSAVENRVDPWYPI